MTTTTCGRTDVVTTVTGQELLFRCDRELDHPGRHHAANVEGIEIFWGRGYTVAADASARSRQPRWALHVALDYHKSSGCASIREFGSPGCDCYSDLQRKWADELAESLAERAAPRAEGLRELEAAFNADASRWLAEGSGMTREQETGAAMVWSWLQQQERRDKAESTDTPDAPSDARDGSVQSAEGTSCDCPGPKAGYHSAHLDDCPRREARPFA